MFEHLVTESIKTLVPYPPGKPPEELERELGISGALKLASNENPLGPSPKAVEAIVKALPNLHRYPDGRGYYLKEALARRLNLGMNQIILGNGSNEIIELAIRTFLRPENNAVFSDPTFLIYSKVVQGAGCAARCVPLKNFHHDLNGLANAVDDHTRLIFVDNPNNPTGSLVPAGDLARFIRDLPKTVLLIMDEAYRDFSRNRELIDPLPFLDEGRPVVFMRTFSKAYGLAGLRVGYGLAHPELIDYMERVRQPFNVNSLGQVGALAAMGDEDFYRRTLETTWAGLDWLAAELKKIGLKTHPTQTNFMMIELPCSADEVFKRMQRLGVIVRSLSAYGYDRIIRINPGAPADNVRFLEALKKTLETAG